jgi:Raf kinase inhibitor-like YbhB/YbcL family protein
MRTSLIALLALATPALAAGKFTLASPDLKEGATVGDKHVFKGMDCTGENISPGLSWKDAPKDTKSFVLTVYDPDAPTGSGWWHWTVYNIPATATEIPEGKVPEGAVEGRTDFGKPGYGGPCPPPGDKPHRYVFTLYALKTDKIDVPPDASAAMVGFYANNKQIQLGKATFTAKYGRKK